VHYKNNFQFLGPASIRKKRNHRNFRREGKGVILNFHNYGDRRNQTEGTEKLEDEPKRRAPKEDLVSLQKKKWS